MDLLVSIIVPIYNVELFLNECVESLIAQTYKNIEIILVDDGSPDTCPQICDQWESKDSRIHVIHKQNGGLSDARNAGIEVSNGDYIMFVDSDDKIAEDTVLELLNIQYQTKADIVCGGFYRYTSGKIEQIYNEIIDVDFVVFSGVEQVKNILTSRTDCSSCCKLYKKSLLEHHRFIKGRYNEDVIFLFNLYLKCNSIAYTQKRFYYYRETIGSVTQKLSNKTMHYLTNCLEMEETVKSLNIPVLNEMNIYKLRVCLELGYRIFRENARCEYLEQANYAKKIIRQNLFSIIVNKFFDCRDFIHAIIIIVLL